MSQNPSSSGLNIVGQKAKTSTVPVVSAKEFAGNASIITLGCSKNLVDSEVMLGALASRGFQSVPDPENADIIVVNTCAFLESAVEESIDRILEVSELKARGRCRQLVVAGCMVERYREQLVAELPEVDQFISTDELLKVGQSAETSVECFDKARRPYFIYDENAPRVRSTGKAWTYLKISEGCDRPCTFCIIPKIRGSFRSRSIASIEAEASSLLADGVRELNLIAQDLTAYGTDFEGGRGIKSALPELLKRIDAINSAEEFWVRLFYAYPVGTTEALINQLTELRNVCAYLDIPLQHISHPVLKAMQRPLGEKGTRRLIEMIRTKAPRLALRTTFIVGFPGETEEDVAALEAFVREGHFMHVGVFTYSHESEAAAAKLDGQLSEELKQQRRDRIMLAQQEVLKTKLESFVGSRQKVLLLGAHSDTDSLLVGRTEFQGPEADGETIINDVAAELGELDWSQLGGRFAEVEITEIAGYDLVGTLVGLS
ncbi:MAG: 30S ribosomal protein S12 methylthiotransferase RimO [Bdellovibrionales bacterium]|nr:30S ribosomal protein S12 methylthiotransferase RimO [Bdellovibrionales bacterium]